MLDFFYLASYSGDYNTAKKMAEKY